LKAYSLREAPQKRAMLENKMRYELLLRGVVVGEAYYNMRGYVLDGLKTPDGARVCIGEGPITTIRREIAAVNRLWEQAGT
jgi:hypothetical protein